MQHDRRSRRLHHDCLYRGYRGLHFFRGRDRPELTMTNYEIAMFSLDAAAMLYFAARVWIGR